MRKAKVVRHGKAKSAEEGQQDQDRQLSEVGIQQATNRGSVTDFSNVNVVISSSAPRAFMTARLATGFSIDDIVKLDELYPAPTDDVGIEIDRLFNLLAYAPVAEYLAQEGGDCVMTWAERVWPVVESKISTGDDEIAVFGHAVCLPALGMVICKDNHVLVEQLAMISLGEAEGFEISFDDDGKPVAVNMITG